MPYCIDHKYIEVRCVTRINFEFRKAARNMGLASGNLVSRSIAGTHRLFTGLGKNAESQPVLMVVCGQHRPPIESHVQKVSSMSSM